MKPHPAADIFPMQSEDGLQSLAESIKANGLRFPIVRRKVNDEWELIDGRNRLRACEIAGVEPTFTQFEGDDDAVLAFIADVNLQRRDLKKTQKAALYAEMYPDPAKPGPKSINEINNPTINSINGEFVNSDKFFPGQLSKCRAVGRYSAALLADVINDRVPLETAYNEAKAALARSNSADAVKERLREASPELADLVEEGRITVEAAQVEIGKRKEADREAVEHGKRAADAIARLEQHVTSVSLAAKIAKEPIITREQFDAAAKAFAKLTELMEASNG